MSAPDPDITTMSKLICSFLTLNSVHVALGIFGRPDFEGLEPHWSMFLTKMEFRFVLIQELMGMKLFTVVTCWRSFL